MRAGQQYGMQPQQQQGKDNIAYNVEHVFKDENGREVRKMPVEIEGETIWVECVPGGAGERQDGGDGAIVLNMEDHEEIPKAVVKPPNSGLTTKNLTPEQRQQIINECVEEMISPTDLARKWNCNADTIRTWVRKAGLTLPKQYKKSIYPDSGNSPARAMGRSTPSTSSGYPPMGAVSQGLSGVTTGAMTPPSIDSPPCSSGGEGSALSASSSSGSGSGQVSKRIPGKLAMCKSCGFTSEDLAICVRCRRKMPDDVKILDDPSYKPKPDSTELMGTKKLRLARLPGKRNRRPGNPDEPVCIALSSDEEGGDEDENSRSSTAEQTGDQQGRRVGLEEQGDDGVVVEERITDGSVAGPWCSLPCRSIRIGNYKVLPKDKLTVTARGIQFKVPGILPPQEVITIAIGMNDILKVLAHFGKSMPLLFLYVSQDACARVRRQLKMVNNQSFFLEVQSPDETQKRITILPEKLTEENKAVLKQHFESKLQELESKDANEILVRSSPKDIAMLKAKMIGTHMQGGSKNTAMAEQAVVKYCQYPPDSPGNVSITNEDYNCLEAEQFLNDVIIDFYLKYIQTELFGTVDQWSKRTHIFTTYFYKRLTTRPPNSKTKAHPIEDNPNLSAAEKRYERVKKWTKKVNIFDKDFIVVPINEHAHWFVCVICFPGQEGCVRADDGTACEPVASSKTPGTKKKKRAVKKPTMQIGATTIIPLSGREDVAIRYNVEEDSDRDEAEASDDDMEDEEGEGVEARKPGEEGDGSEPPPAVRRPCILIFDSLKGGSKARTCQTLRDYLSCEWKAKMVPNGKEERRFDNGLMPGSQPTVQQQPNFSDCGIYLLQYIQSFFRDPISDYNFPIRSVRQWFSKEEVEGKRGNIAELIRKLTGEQNPEKEINFPQLNFLNPEIEGEESEEEDEEEDEGGERQPPTSAVVGSSVVRLTAAPANATPGRLLVTPAKQQGKVLIQKTGTFNPTQLAALTAVPPGVTVTPARTLATNISIRKVQPVSSSRPMPSASTSSSSSSLVAIGDTIQTSPDSTSHEDSYGEGSTGGRSEADGQGDQGLPDSQGFESGKRSAETPDGETGRAKRTKSEEET